MSPSREEKQKIEDQNGGQGKNGGLDIDSWFHVDSLGATSIEPHDFWIVELAIIDSYLMVLVANYLEAESAIQRISARPLGTNIDSIQVYLIAAHALGDYYGGGVTGRWSGSLGNCR